MPVMQPPPVLDKWVMLKELLRRKTAGLVSESVICSAPGNIVAGGAAEHPTQEADLSIDAQQIETNDAR